MLVSTYERSEFNWAVWPTIGTVDFLAKQFLLHKPDIERFVIIGRFSQKTQNYAYDFVTPGIVLQEEDIAFIRQNFPGDWQLEFYSCPVDMLEIYKNAL
jgi:hypothetical protein